MKKQLLFSILMLASGIIASAQNLVGHWEFSGNANDASSNGLHGTVVGTGATYVPGRANVANTAIRLTNPTTSTATGGTYVSVPTNTKLNLTKWTIMASVKFLDWYDGNCQAQNIVSRSTNNTAQYYCMQVNDNERDLAAGINDDNTRCQTNTGTGHTLGGGAPGPASLPATMPSPPSSYLNLNTWYCLTVTYDGQQVRSYVEGVLTNITNWPNAAGGTSNDPLIFGCYLGGVASGFPYWLNGAIDDIQLYDGAFTPGQVAWANCSKVYSDPWLTAANTISGGNNLFGTITNDDVMVRTFNQNRGIFTKTGSFGFGTTTPGNKVEIKSASANASGLRLGNLTSSSPTVTNPAGSVLSVNSSGDVVLVQDATAGVANEGLSQNGNQIELGYPCTGTATGLFSGSRVIPMNNYDLSFSTNDNGKIYMGLMGPCPTLQSRLELNTNGLSPQALNSYATGRASKSGLRFQNLTALSPLIPNEKGGVLSLDDEGDVIWVATNGVANNGLTQSNGAIQLGRDCASPNGGGDLLTDRLISMNDKNLIFKDGNLVGGQNRIGLGTSGCVPGAKLDVIRNNENFDFDPLNIAISGVNKDFSSNTAIGVRGRADNFMNNFNIGGDFEALDAGGYVHGVRGVGLTNSGGQAIGGWFMACGPGINYGIYAQACQSHNEGRGPSYAGYFNGDVFSTGSYMPSDQRLKQNVQPITDALSILDRITPKKYNFNTAAYPNLNLPSGVSYGVMSQELEKVLPSLIKETAIPDGEKGFTGETIKAVNYTELIPILIQAVKDQQKQIEALSARLNTPQERSPSGQSMEVELGDKDEAYLEQNAPNPYNEFTLIGYYLPVKVKAAFMQFATVDGKILKSIEIPMRGKGSLNVHTPELVPGTYVYTLYADGKIIDTKRMQILK